MIMQMLFKQLIFLFVYFKICLVEYRLKTLEMAVETV